MNVKNINDKKHNIFLYNTVNDNGVKRYSIPKEIDILEN